MSDTNTFVKEMGARVRKRRLEIGLTQEELAQRAKYAHKTSISKIEQGKSEIPQEKMRDFAEALNTTIAYLMGWTQDIDNRTGLSVEERQLISYYRSLNGAGKVAMMSMVQGLVDSGVYSEDTRSVGA